MKCTEVLKVTVHKLRCHYFVMKSIDEVQDDFKGKQIKSNQIK